MPRIALTISLLTLAATCFADDHGRNSLIVLALWSFLFSVFWLLSRRVMWSLVVVSGLMAVVSAISYFKSAYMGFDLHAADFAYALPRFDQMRFLIKSYWVQALVSMTLLVGFSLLAFLAWRSDEPTHVSGIGRTAAMAIFALPMLMFHPTPGSTGGYYLSRYHASSLFISLSDFFVMQRDTEVRERIDNAAPQSSRIYSWVCNADPAGLPDIVVVLQESQFRITDYPSLRIDSAISEEIGLREKAMMPLRVETAGGGTWISTFGLMTGLPAAVFGWSRPYITMIMGNKISTSLPVQLKACGYNTIALLAGKSTFAGEGSFLSSIGFDEIDDLQASPKNIDHNDSFYFGRVLDQFRSRESGSPPVMIFVQTMALHSPYYASTRELPKLVASPFAQRGWNVYVNRLLDSRRHFTSFLDELESLKRQRGVVVLEFGDHRPNLVFEDPANKDKLSDWRSDIYQTYYQFHEIDFTPRNRGIDKPIDIGLLGTELLDKIGITGDQSIQRLRQLREACGGAYYTCQQQAKVNQHLKWLADSGLVKFP